MSRTRLLAERGARRLGLDRMLRLRIIAADLEESMAENLVLEQQLGTHLDALEAAVGEVAYTWLQARTRQPTRPGDLGHGGSGTFG